MYVLGLNIRIDSTRRRPYTIPKKRDYKRVVGKQCTNNMMSSLAFHEVVRKGRRIKGSRRSL